LKKLNAFVSDLLREEKITWAWVVVICTYNH